MIILESASAKETKKIAAMLAAEVVKSQRKNALVLALEGNLGSGKTTFAQGFAEALGIKEKVLSPTFVLMKFYELKPRPFWKIRHLVHIDCYRLDSPKELSHLGFQNLLRDKDAVILIEWADKVKKILPTGILRIKFSYSKKINKRIIKLG
jgi:tRNA threonylcarbamoyladenosine biosynthesis protein TsaE